MENTRTSLNFLLILKAAEGPDPASAVCPDKRATGPETEDHLQAVWARSCIAPEEGTIRLEFAEGGKKVLKVFGITHARFQL